MKLDSIADVNTLDQDEFDKLNPEQIRAMAGESEEEGTEEEQPDHQEVEGESEDDEEAGTADEDNPEDEPETDDELDSKPDNQDDTPEGDDKNNLDADEEEVSKGTSVKADKTKKAKSPEQDKTEVTEQQKTEVDHKAFYERITSKFKAAGTELAVTNPDDIISLMQKGADYTKKMQAVSHLKGLNEVLRENGLDDPAEFGYLIDLKNHKPEAIARLLKESGLDAFELDEEKAASYQAPSINFEAKTKAVNVREIVEAHANDAEFNEVFTNARTWDDISQQEIVNDPTLLVTMAEHKRNGVYDRIMQEMQNERLVRGNVNEPALQQYVRIGHALYGGNQNGGSAQVPDNGLTRQAAPANKQRVVVKSTKNITEQRKRVAPTANAPKGKRALNVRAPVDIFNMDQDDFNKLSPEILRSLSKG